MRLGKWGGTQARLSFRLACPSTLVLRASIFRSLRGAAFAYSQISKRD